MNIKIAVLYAPGINCHEEMKFALDFVGLDSKIINIHDLLDGKEKLTNYQAMVIPGGFSWGDHLGAGRIFGVHLVARLAEQLYEMVNDNKPILGVCNGFQVLVETGLLPNKSIGKRGAALLRNESAVFECRWVELIVTNPNTIWTNNLEGKILRMPVAHGEGRLYSESMEELNKVVCYSKNGKATEEYPANPNGTIGGAAGIADSSGMIFGLMPHPERAVLDWQGSTDGLYILNNLKAYLHN